MSGSAYGAPGSYQSPGDIYSYPPPNPPPNPYPAPHTHGYPQQPQSYARGPHRPFHTGTGASSPNTGSPHSFSTSSPHPYSSQSQGGYPPLPGSHQHPNGYNTPPQLRLDPPLRGDDSYLRADSMYPPPPPPRPDNTYIPPPNLPSHIHPHSQYTLPPLDPTGPAAPRRSPPRRLRSHIQGRANEDGYEDSVGRRGSGLSSMLDLLPAPVGGEVPSLPSGVGLGLPAVGSGASAWEGAGTARELLNAFMAASGNGSSSGPGPERTSAPGSAVMGAGESGELDWPVHVPPSAKPVGSGGPAPGAGGGVAGGEKTRDSVPVAKLEQRRATPETHTISRSPAPTAKEVDTKVDSPSTGPATSSSAKSPKPEAAPERAPPPSESGVPILEKADRRTTDQESPTLNSSKAIPTERPLPGENPNEVDWLDFLSGAAAEANAAQRTSAEKDAAISDTSKVGVAGHRSSDGQTGAGAGVGMAIDADVDEGNAEDAEGEPDIEEDEPNTGKPSSGQGVAPSATDSNASSVRGKDKTKSPSAERTLPPKARKEMAKGGPMMGAVSAATTEGTTRGSPKDQATKDETGDDMTVDRAE
ncbi:hypothetical protein BDZ94DRAFT_83433 [Collybia nuda]|uniref:Uncharacterized protein n=1 Tax=Collybia nuda TaxID=64659 RepID=A0A9P5XXV5_9AGAR|nr:hypothetical protein BDZ94DRAFT_83433 [Collybia nuda]